MNKFIRYSIFQNLRWQMSIKSRNQFRNAISMFTFFSMMIGIACLIAVDSILGLGSIKQGIIGLTLTLLIFDWFLHKYIEEIGIQGLTDEFLKGDVLMNKIERYVFDLIAIFIIFSPAMSIMVFVDKA